MQAIRQSPRLKQPSRSARSNKEKKIDATAQVEASMASSESESHDEEDAFEMPQPKRQRQKKQVAEPDSPKTLSAKKPRKSPANGGTKKKKAPGVKSGKNAQAFDQEEVCPLELMPEAIGVESSAFLVDQYIKQMAAVASGKEYEPPVLLPSPLISKRKQQKATKSSSAAGQLKPTGQPQSVGAGAGTAEGRPEAGEPQGTKPRRGSKPKKQLGTREKNQAPPTPREDVPSEVPGTADDQTPLSTALNDPIFTSNQAVLDILQVIEEAETTGPSKSAAELKKLKKCIITASNNLTKAKSLLSSFPTFAEKVEAVKTGEASERQGRKVGSREAIREKLKKSLKESEESTRRDELKPNPKSIGSIKKNKLDLEEVFLLKEKEKYLVEKASQVLRDFGNSQDTTGLSLTQSEPQQATAETPDEDLPQIVSKSEAEPEIKPSSKPKAANRRPERRSGRLRTKRFEPYFLQMDENSGDILNSDEDDLEQPPEMVRQLVSKIKEKKEVFQNFATLTGEQKTRKRLPQATKSSKEKSIVVQAEQESSSLLPPLPAMRVITNSRRDPLELYMEQQQSIKDRFAEFSQEQNAAFAFPKVYSEFSSRVGELLCVGRGPSFQTQASPPAPTPKNPSLIKLESCEPSLLIDHHLEASLHCEVSSSSESKPSPLPEDKIAALLHSPTRKAIMAMAVTCVEINYLPSHFEVPPGYNLLQLKPELPSNLKELLDRHKAKASKLIRAIADFKPTPSVFIIRKVCRFDKEFNQVLPDGRVYVHRPDPKPYAGSTLLPPDFNSSGRGRMRPCLQLPNMPNVTNLAGRPTASTPAPAFPQASAPQHLQGPPTTSPPSKANNDALCFSPSHEQESRKWHEITQDIATRIYPREFYQSEMYNRISRYRFKKELTPLEREQVIAKTVYNIPEMRNFNPRQNLWNLHFSALQDPDLAEPDKLVYRANFDLTTKSSVEEINTQIFGYLTSRAQIDIDYELTKKFRRTIYHSLFSIKKSLAVQNRVLKFLYRALQIDRHLKFRKGEEISLGVGLRQYKQENNADVREAIRDSRFKGQDSLQGIKVDEACFNPNFLQAFDFLPDNNHQRSCDVTMLRFRVMFIALLSGFIALPRGEGTEDDFSHEIVKIECRGKAVNHQAENQQRSPSSPSGFGEPANVVKKCPFYLIYRRAVDPNRIHTDSEYGLFEYNFLHNHQLDLGFSESPQYQKELQLRSSKQRPPADGATAVGTSSAELKEKMPPQSPPKGSLQKFGREAFGRETGCSETRPSSVPKEGRPPAQALGAQRQRAPPPPFGFGSIAQDMTAGTFTKLSSSLPQGQLDFGKKRVLKQIEKDLQHQETEQEKRLRLAYGIESRFPLNNGQAERVEPQGFLGQKRAFAQTATAGQARAPPEVDSLNEPRKHVRFEAPSSEEDSYTCPPQQGSSTSLSGQSDHSDQSETSSSAKPSSRTPPSDGFALHQEGQKPESLKKPSDSDPRERKQSSKKKKSKSKKKHEKKAKKKSKSDRKEKQSSDTSEEGTSKKPLLSLRPMKPLPAPAPIEDDSELIMQPCSPTARGLNSNESKGLGTAAVSGTNLDSSAGLQSSAELLIIDD